MADKTKVRVTQEPGVVREVDDRELVDLQRQGILHSFEHTEHALHVLPKSYKAPNRWRGAEKGEEIIEATAAMTEPPATVNEKKGA